MYRNRLAEKLKEAVGAVVPIVAIVLALALTVAPIPSGTLLTFLAGGVLLVVGMMFFTLGAELAMQPMGEKMGASLTRTRKLWLILPISFALGAMITVSEPDLQVLAGQVTAIPSNILIWSVGLGVGAFLLLSILRMLFRIPLQWLLLGLYAGVFVLAAFAPKDFLAVAFDSGGVTTGPMTVPFILSFGIGIAAIRNDRSAADDSMGLIALCSVGPIAMVLLLSLIYRPDSADVAETLVPDAAQSVEMGRLFWQGFPIYIREIAVSLLPIVGFFAVYQLFLLKLNRSTLVRIGVGVLYTYVGLTVFLTGVNVGFMPAGYFLGETLAKLPYNWVVIPLGMLIDYFIVKAEPAVYVLMNQVEEITDGAVTGRTLQLTLSLGVAVSVGLAMLRVLTGLSVMWLLIPGYALAMLLSFFVPPIFTAIAFDSGGVASGPMTATFLLPFAMGACTALGGSVVTDAFGVVAMVAMTPLLAIQLLGVLFRLRAKKKAAVPAAAEAFAELDNYAIIEL